VVGCLIRDPDFSGNGDSSGECVTAKRGVSSVGRVSMRDSAKSNLLAELAPLPCTRAEGQALAKVIGGTVLFGGDAREASLRLPAVAASLEKATVVSFATHGLVAGELGQTEPGLALAAPRKNETQDNGYLSASKVLELKLTADWVILSGCNTAGPDKYDSEGLSGLSRAFFAVGAKSILASNWRVFDESTQTLMTDTVTARKAGETKGQALRRASLAILNGSGSGNSSKYAHPVNWAPFMLIGDPR
jgi:CHAT domain-containing protein